MCDTVTKVFMPPTPGPGELYFILTMLVFVFFGEKIPRIAAFFKK